MKRLIPETIVARTLLVLIIGLTISHTLSVALYFTDQSTALMFAGEEHIGDHIVTISRLTETASQAERQRIVELADDPKLHVFWSRESAIRDDRTGGWKADILRGILDAHFGNRRERGFRLRYTEAIMADPWQEHIQQRHGGGELGKTLMVSLRLPDMSWLNFAAPVESPAPFWSLRFALSMVVMLLAVGIFSALVVRHLTRPLANFARAAQRLGVDVKAPSLPESGPAEVRQAAQAFNEMQERIRRFVEDRTQMVAAISHDLGTPITRLRLRAEFVEDEETRKKMLADLEDMEKMVFSVLSFARNEAASEPHAMVDLRTLLHRVCDDMADAGHPVSLDAGDDAVAYGCRPAALRRALTNLIDNAVKYGRQARVSLDATPDTVLIRIDDDGPGIPEELREEIFKPFQRLEASRSRETGGSGLGLTVARTIIRAHGGDVVLVNRSEGGLRAEVRLPHPVSTSWTG
jgi:signal transduction histidine kinase